MIVCVCNNISDREIRQAVDLGITTMDELRRDLGVATCCGQCASYAEDVLTTHLAQIAATAATVASEEATSASFTELRFSARQSA